MDNQKPILMDGESVAAYLDRVKEWKAKGDWFPASGGTETPFNTRGGRRLLYCYQPRSGRHSYLDMGSDMIIPDDEIGLYLG